MSYDEILASIDGALADDEFPDAMRWSPEPETVDAPAPFDGTLVWQRAPASLSVERVWFRWANERERLARGDGSRPGDAR